jgi:hypothetical protein
MSTLKAKEPASHCLIEFEDFTWRLASMFLFWPCCGIAGGVYSTTLFSASRQSVLLQGHANPVTPLLRLSLEAPPLLLRGKQALPPPALDLCLCSFCCGSASADSLVVEHAPTSTPSLPWASAGSPSPTWPTYLHPHLQIFARHLLSERGVCTVAFCFCAAPRLPAHSPNHSMSALNVLHM